MLSNAEQSLQYVGSSLSLTATTPAPRHIAAKSTTKSYVARESLVGPRLLRKIAVKNCKFERHSKHMRALNTLVIRRPQSVRFLRYSKTIQFAIYIEVEEQKEDRHEMNASKVDGGGRTDSCQQILCREMCMCVCLFWGLLSCSSVTLSVNLTSACHQDKLSST